MAPNLAWGGFANGRIPRGNLVDIGAGKLLQADAAYNWGRFRNAFYSRWGQPLYLADYQDAYRDLALQQYMWDHRNSGPPHPSKVASPGNSIHGWARSVDCSGYGQAGSARHNWMVANSPSYGWSWDYGQSLNESWHWDYVGPITTTAGDGGVTPFPPEPEEPRKVNPVISVNFCYRSGHGQYIMYTSATRVSLTQELSSLVATNPGLRAQLVNTAIALGKTAGLPLTNEASIPVLDDTPNSGWYLRNQLAYVAAGMPSSYALSPTNPWQISLGIAGALTPAQDAALMGLPTSVADIPTASEIEQALTSTVILVNDHADVNKGEILEAIEEIPAGGGGGGNYALSLDIDNVPGTATGTAVPTA